MESAIKIRTNDGICLNDSHLKSDVDDVVILDYLSDNKYIVIRNGEQYTGKYVEGSNCQTSSTQLSNNTNTATPSLASSRAYPSQPLT